MATRRGDFERAQKLLAESLALYRAVGSKFDIGGSLEHLGFVARIFRQCLGTAI